MASEPKTMLAMKSIGKKGWCNTTWAVFLDMMGDDDIAKRLKNQPPPGENIKITTNDYGHAVHPDDRDVPEGVWSAFFDHDDFSVAVFDKEGEPVFAYYSSTRGPYYQDGLYIHKGEKHYCVTNVTKDQERKGWVRRKGLSSEVARDFLLGEDESKMYGDEQFE